MKYAVIKVDQCFSDIEGVTCLATFKTESEANGFVVKLEKEENESAMSFIQYRDAFVEAIKLPTTSWIEFLEKFNLGIYVTPENFHRELSWRLDKHSEVEGFNPPEIIDAGNLFVVEIPCTL